ncbi:MAG TPA: hypothetical protein VJY65_10150 [Chloroflexota bacterium]|nr:hypothetical protein [Chloroflexota bacterium]
MAHFDAVQPRGEFTLVVSGAQPSGPRPPTLTDDEVTSRLIAAMRGGEDMRVVVTDLARTTGRPRRDMYARWQELRRSSQ